MSARYACCQHCEHDGTEHGHSAEGHPVACVMREMVGGRWYATCVTVPFEVTE